MPCPTAEVVVAYQQGDLDASRHREVGEHVARCHECQDLVQRCYAFDQPPEPFGWLARVVLRWRAWHSWRRFQRSNRSRPG